MRAVAFKFVNRRCLLADDDVEGYGLGSVQKARGPNNQAPTRPGCSSAASRHAIRFGVAKRLGKEAGRVGLLRTGAEAFIGECCDEDEGRDVAPRMRMFASSSRPFISDICTSEIAHDVSFN